MTGGEQSSSSEAELSVDERKLALERDRLALEREKWALERTLKESERRSPWTSPLLIGVLTVAGAAAGNALVSRLNAEGQIRLERLRGEQNLITEMIKTGGNAENTAANLRFLIESGLVTDERAARMKAYLDQRKQRPDLLPSLPSSGNSATSVVERAKSIAANPAGACRPPTGEAFCIQDHVLIGAAGKPVDIVDANSRGQKLGQAPMAVVLHFTAGPDGGAKAAFSRSGILPASAHFEINRDGSISQFVPLDVAAYHTGASQWKGLKGLNSKTIGVEFANWGQLTGAPGRWRTFSGRQVPDSTVYMHTDPATGTVTGWERFTDAQLAAGERVVSALVRQYPSIEAVLGHSELDPRGRKLDPGPALPMARFRRLVSARRS